LIQVADVLFFVVAKATGAGGADSQNGCAEEAGDCQDLTTICAFFLVPEWNTNHCMSLH